MWHQIVIYRINKTEVIWRVIIIKLGLNVALTQQIVSYCDSIKEKEEREGATIRIDSDTKLKRKQLLFVWSLAYNMSNLSDPFRNMRYPVGLACKIIKTHKPPRQLSCKPHGRGKQKSWKQYQGKDKEWDYKQINNKKQNTAVVDLFQH